MERTLVLAKPDAVQRGLVGEIIGRFERRGLRLLAVKMLCIDEELARRHYAVHEGKPFFEKLIRYITSGPVVAMVVAGDRAVDTVRLVMGATDPVKAAPGTIRADYAMDMERNLVHGSDSLESARKEVALFFRDEEICEYRRADDVWVYPRAQAVG
ncbi:MAG: nucleoside-diphosphate kinase [Anaerolineae bacterium]|nr:nucleoside-diphosphate kinase [Anaerolineae bacterium]